MKSGGVFLRYEDLVSPPVQAVSYAIGDEVGKGEVGGVSYSLCLMTSWALVLKVKPGVMERSWAICQTVGVHPPAPPFTFGTSRSLS